MFLQLLVSIQIDFLLIHILRFYVGRFEAGLDSNIEELDVIAQDTMEIAYNVEGTPQSKAGAIPWMLVDYTNSKKSAENMYDGRINTVQSGLITGTMWDTMLTWMVDGDRTSTKLTNSAWGNYTNTTPEINLGRKGYAYVSNGSWNIEPFDKQWSQSTEQNKIIKPIGTEDTNNNGKCHILTTGASEECKLKNLYDVAGNLWEWTEEVAVATKSNGVLNAERVCRSGAAIETSVNYPACYHGCSNINNTHVYIGFRVALYMK